MKRRERQRGKEDRERCRDEWRQRKNLDGDSIKNMRLKKKVIQRKRLTNYPPREKGKRDTSHSPREVKPIRPLCCYMKKTNMRTQGEEGVFTEY